LKEALRVSKRYVICAFPNFAYFRSRLELMLFGIFPKATFFGYSWYDSQHIRLFSYKDFLKALQRLNFNVSVADKKFISSKIVPKPFQKIAPNIFALVCVLKIDKRSFDYDKVASWKFDV
jgi:methionine biosynthesis protein MetW